MVYLKKINSNYSSYRYLSWMKDYATIKYTNQIFKKQSIKIIKKYIQMVNKSKRDIFRGIFVKSKRKSIHVGNIKLGPIDWDHKYGMVSIIIGDKNFRNKKIGTKAIKLICQLAKKLKLKKLYSGCYKPNIRSQKIFLKNNFKKEGVLIKHVIFNNKRIDLIQFGKVIK